MQHGLFILSIRIRQILLSLLLQLKQSAMKWLDSEISMPSFFSLRAASNDVR